MMRAGDRARKIMRGVPVECTLLQRKTWLHSADVEITNLDLIEDADVFFFFFHVRSGISSRKMSYEPMTAIQGWIISNPSCYVLV